MTDLLPHLHEVFMHTLSVPGAADGALARAARQAIDPARPAQPAATKPRRGRPPAGKTRITIYLDDEVLEQFRKLADERGTGYQTLINATLRSRLPSEPGASGQA